MKLEWDWNFEEVNKLFSGPHWNCPSSVKMFKCFDYHQCEGLFCAHFKTKIMCLALIGEKIFFKCNSPFLAKSLVLGKKGRTIIVRLDLLYNFSPGKKIDGMHRKVCTPKKPEKMKLEWDWNFEEVNKFFSGPHWNCPSSVKVFKCFDYHQCEGLFCAHFKTKIMCLALIGEKIFLKSNPPFLAKSLVLGKKGRIIILRIDLLYHFSPGKKFDGMHRKVCTPKKPEKWDLNPILGDNP